MKQEHQFSFRFKEWHLLHNVLNEVTHGFRVEDHQAVIGMPKSDLEQFLDYLHKLSHQRAVKLDLKWLTVFRNALMESLRRIHVSEFQTRTGYYPDEAQAILEKLNRMISSVQ